MLSAEISRLPLARPFAIARGSRTEQPVVRAHLLWQGMKGRGECTPYPRYGETPELVAEQVEGQSAWLLSALDQGPASARSALLNKLPACAARNAIDCALWDLQSKRDSRSIWHIAGTPRPKGLRSVLTLSIDVPQAMAKAAKALPTDAIKVKLGLGDGLDCDRIIAVRDARPDAWLMTDSNEGMKEEDLPEFLEICRATSVGLIEQPLPAGKEAILEKLRLNGMTEGLVICADESCRKDPDMGELARAYDAVNLKLDKTGGLTQGLRDVQSAQEAGLRVMVGCMVGSSLAMAPGVVLAAAAGANPIDLDGPLWLASDETPSVVDSHGLVSGPESGLFG